MKFEINEEKQEPVVRLELRYDGNGNDVDVISIVGDDECPLISFNADGTLYRYGSIDENIGFKVNKNKQIIERK